MTLDDFLEELAEDRETARWAYKGDAVIRDDGGRCPICHVCLRLKNEDWANAEYDLAARAINLEFRDANAVIYAADGGADPLRERLLDACGLTRREGY